MDCDRVRDTILGELATGAEGTWPEAVARHLADCAGCRRELASLKTAWAALQALPEATPSAAVRERLARRVRRELLRAWVLTPRSWAAAAAAALAGVGLSLGLSLVVPYAALVAWCQRLWPAADPPWAAYALAGTAYGLPLLVGAWALCRRPLGGAVVGGLEASVLFLLVLVPYAVVQCREFPPAFQAAFVSGLAGGGLLGTLVAVGLSRVTRMAGSRA